jgi:hypothetical protein
MVCSNDEADEEDTVTKKPIACTPKSLPPQRVVEAAEHAVRENPANQARYAKLLTAIPGFAPKKEHIALMTSRYWGASGVNLTVSFLDNPVSALRTRIIGHMNAWARDSNVVFSETQGQSHVRIARNAGDGYWSYIGTDINLIALDQPTMNLDSFTMDTPDSEFFRVVRHETGHTLGFVHEHMRRALVEKIDVKKAIAYYKETQGWSEAEVRAQVLTPIEETQLRATVPDPDSIMCYQVPAEITIDNETIVGGTDIDALDYSLCSTLYPKPAQALAVGSRVNGSASALVFVSSPDPAYVAAVISATRNS